MRTISVTLSTTEQKILEKRAKKNLMTIEELVQDIVRRSAVSTKENAGTDNVEDKFLSFFSRKRK